MKPRQPLSFQAVVAELAAKVATRGKRGLRAHKPSQPVCWSRVYLHELTLPEISVINAFNLEK